MDEIDGRVAELKRQVERRRFAGGDPVVDLVPRLSQTEVVARVLAAERAGALLAIGDRRLNPAADHADAAMRDAVGALRAWNFAAARARLDEAAGRAHDPVMQQRIALYKALTRYCSALIYVPLAEKLRLGLAELNGVLAGLDFLTVAERRHYRDEVDRLLTQREAAAAGDPFLNATWTLIRAHLAMNAGQDEAALLWLLGLAARADLPLEGYLTDLIGRARRSILAMIGPPPENEAKAEPVRARELFNALAAHLGAALGHDPAQGMGRFALAEYVAADVGDE